MNNISTERNYYRIFLGRDAEVAQICHKGNYIGTGWFDENLTEKLTGSLDDFYNNYGRHYYEGKKHSSKMTYLVCKGIQQNDIVLCPNRKGLYWVGRVIGGYVYEPQAGGGLVHRRPVEWYAEIGAADMSLELKKFAQTPPTAINITKHADEIEKLLTGAKATGLHVDDETVEDPSIFALEKHLEDFIVTNWDKTDLAKTHDILKDKKGRIIGQQHKTDTGYIDILAISKNSKGKKEFLVIELKKGRASDKVIGQTQRYMGDVTEQLAKNGETVRGLIIAFDNDLKMERALSVANDIDFYRYEVNFRLFKGGMSQEEKEIVESELESDK